MVAYSEKIKVLSCRIGVVGLHPVSTASWHCIRFCITRNGRWSVISYDILHTFPPRSF